MLYCEAQPGYIAWLNAIFDGMMGEQRSVDLNGMFGELLVKKLNSMLDGESL